MLVYRTRENQRILVSQARRVHLLGPNSPDVLINMDTSDADSEAGSLPETLDQVKIPKGMRDLAIEDVIPEVFLAFMWRKTKRDLSKHDN